MTDQQPTLAQRAQSVFADKDEGRRRVTWDELVGLDPLEANVFVEMLKSEALRRDLDLKVWSVTTALFDGIEVHWRPNSGPR